MALRDLRRVLHKDCMTAPFYASDGVALYLGDMLTLLPTLEPDSIDAVVCDPPYELNFMGKSWDQSGIAFNPETWRLVFRVLKPGGHLLAFGGTRTFHRMTCAIEDAEFEIRDCLSWMYGSGFPKSLDVSKAIDRQLGQPRQVAGIGEAVDRVALDYGGATGKAKNGLKSDWADNTSANTEDAAQWQGWGTALKPAWEPIVMARKPLIGTVAANVLAHGTGALNIEATRIATSDNLNGWRFKRTGGAGEFKQPDGRWPANVVLDEEAGALLDEQSGDLASGGSDTASSRIVGIYEDGLRKRVITPRFDTGGASRFFYCAKTSTKERNFGGVKNTHPTVKPVKLMRWLVKLVTRKGGVVLDPFTGSGTTGMACVHEGMQFIGIEQHPPYIEIAKERIAAVAPQVVQGENQVTAIQPSLF
jgi:site-specific DNA-methyltransferase (adenine-specific)